MSPRVLSRARLVVPPYFVAAGFLAALVLLEAPIVLVEWRLGGRVPMNVRPSAILLIVGAVNYGIFRVSAFHPAFRGGYRGWLESTPWTSRKPLPLGPVELVWEDALVLGPLALLAAALAEGRPVELLCVFSLVYLLALTWSFWLTRGAAFAYATAFALGVPVWYWRQPWACLAAMAGVYLVACAGLRRTLARFPWDQRKVLDPELGGDLFPSSRQPCGWPYDRMLAEVIDDRGIRRVDAALITALGCWWFYVLTSLITAPRDRDVAAMIGFIVATVAAPFIRLIIYAQGYQSPLGPLGRLRTFRWIIPGYDRIVVGPACAATAGLAMLALLSASSVPPPVRFTVSAGMAILAALITPPRLRSWRLTGQHRIVPLPPQNKGGHHELIQVK